MIEKIELKGNDNRFLKKKSLLLVCKILQINVSSNLTKLEVIDKIQQSYLNDKSILKKIYRVTGNKAYTILGKVIANKDFEIDFNFQNMKSISILLALCLIDSIEIIDSRKAKLKAEPKLQSALLETMQDNTDSSTQQDREKCKTIEAILESIIMIYGVMNFREFEQMVKKYINISHKDLFNYLIEDLEIVFKIMKIMTDKNNDNDGIVYYSEIDDIKSIFKEKLKHADLDYKEYTKEELLELYDDPYRLKTNTNVKRLYDYCEKYSKYGTTTFFSQYENMVQEIDCRSYIYMDQFNFDSIDDANHYLEIFMDAYNDIPKFSLYGYSPNEIRKLEVQRQQRKSDKKPGRNDPCYCGSGKKYKNCCMLKDQMEEIQAEQRRDKVIENEYLVENSETINDCLPEKEGRKFFELFFSLLLYVNKKYNIIDDMKDLSYFRTITPENQNKVITKLWENSSTIIPEYISKNPDSFTKEELDIIALWEKKKITDHFVVYKYTNDYTELLGKDCIYKIKGLKKSIRIDIFKEELPMYIETTLLPYEDYIVYDSIISKISISLGPNIKKEIKENYNDLVKQGKVKTQL